MLDITQQYVIEFHAWTQEFSSYSSVMQEDFLLVLYHVLL
jgi:hypothetical protein